MQEENNHLMSMNEDLMSKLRRSDILLNRVNEELARYRTADGKTPHVDLDEAQRLQSKVQVYIREAVDDMMQTGSFERKTVL